MRFVPVSGLVEGMFVAENYTMSITSCCLTATVLYIGPI